MPRMLTIRKRIERLFEKLGHTLYRNHLKTLVLAFLVIGALVAHIPRLDVDMSQESLLRNDDPIRIEYNTFRYEFGADGMIVIAITPSEVFDADFLTTLKAFHEDLENEIPYLREVNSLMNARNTYGEEDTLIVEDLLEDWPEKAIDLADLRQNVLSNPVYLNNFISEDGRVTSVVVETEAALVSQSEAEMLAGFEEETSGSSEIPVEITPQFLSGPQQTEIVEALQRVVGRYQRQDFSVGFAGTPVQFDVFKRMMLQDMRKNIGLLIGMIVLSLFLFFRRISGVLLPLSIVIFSMLSTLGLMAIFQVPFTIPAQIIPQFLMAVGIGDSIHVLAIFYKRFREGSSKKDAIAYSLGHSGLAIVMTSLTTAAGLLSFAWAELAPIASMGTFCAAGVMLALLYTILLLPAFLAFIPMTHKQKAKESNKEARMDRMLLGFANFAATHPVKILTVSLVIMGIALYCIPRIEFSHDMVAWLPESIKIKQDVQLIDRELKGATTLEVVIDTQQENGLYEPDILHGLETLARKIEIIRDGELLVGKVFSVNDILKETNQALHGNDPAYYAIPKERTLIAQELFLFETSGSDDLESVVDTQFSKARFTIKTSWVEAVMYGEFIKKVKKMFHEVFPEEVDMTFTGLVSVMARAIPASINSAVKSYLIAAVVIALLMISLVGGLRIGLMSMLPNFIPILIVLGFMGLAGIPIDMMSILIGSIALGLVVDDTVHFIYNFRRYSHEIGNTRKALEQTFLGTGRAMVTTSIVLSAGFFVMLSASMLNIQRFGLLVTMTIVVALLADFVLSPALLVLFATQTATPSVRSAEKQSIHADVA